MKEDFRIDKNHKTPRSILRTIGPIFIILGGIGLLIGLIDFFLAFAGHGSPRLFWCAFLGIPLLGIGAMMTQIGFAGRIMRFMAEETAPVAKDSFNYMASETQEGIRHATQAMGEGLATGIAAAGLGDLFNANKNIRRNEINITIRCHKCNHIAETNARFCDQCGAKLIKTKSCSTCQEINDPDAKYCDHCGNALD